MLDIVVLLLRPISLLMATLLRRGRISIRRESLSSNADSLQSERRVRGHRDVEGIAGVLGDENT
jgi:hypothetical protein